MTQVTTGIRSVLSNPKIYQILQDILGKHTRQSFVDTYIRPQPGQFLLDVGCGTGEITSYLPPGVRYLGIDLSPNYIRYAQANYGSYGQFINSDLKDLDFATIGRPDLVLAMGLLHHLDDPEVVKLFQQIAAIMATTARLVTLDPCLLKTTHPIASWLISIDRGRNVRSPDHYHRLAAQIFQDLTIQVRSDMLRVPYNYAILECKNIYDRSR